MLQLGDGLSAPICAARNMSAVAWPSIAVLWRSVRSSLRKSAVCLA